VVLHAFGRQIGHESVGISFGCVQATGEVRCVRRC
jgi:hypothetical protein